MKLWIVIVSVFAFACGEEAKPDPVEVPDPFNQDLCGNKAVHIYFSQAVPLVPYIDERCLFLEEQKCSICVGVCKTNAIDLHQKPEPLELKVGAIVLAPGYDVFDPAVRGDYVVTPSNLRGDEELEFIGKDPELR